MLMVERIGLNVSIMSDELGKGIQICLRCGKCETLGVSQLSAFTFYTVTVIL